MADEPMTVVEEVNGEEVNDPKVNGVESKDEKEEVTLDAKESDSEVVPVVSKPEADEAIDSTLRLNYDEASTEEQAKNSEEDMKPDETEKNGMEVEPEATEDIPETPVTNKGRKRKASSDDELDLTGFDPPEEPSPLIKSRVDKLEKDIKEAEIESQRWRSSRPSPAKKPHLSSPAHSIEIPSRPSSGLSLRSEGELIGGNGSDLNSSAANSPNPGVPKGRKSTVDLTNPLFRLPLEQGWKRELVYRATLDQYQRRQGDIYYYTPQGKKLRSTREVSEHIMDTGLTIENFTFFKEPLGIDDPEKEIIRDAKLMSRVRTESPVPTPEKQAPASLIREGKRTPKPKGAKGASPERGVSSSPKLNTHFKVKSLGSRLSNQGTVASPAPKAAAAAAKETVKSGPKKLTGAAQSKKNSQDTQPMYVTQSQSVVECSLPRYPPPLTKYGVQHSGAMSPKSGRELCSIHCPLAVGQIPSLQCSLCLCLYHEACARVQAHHIINFVCKSCQMADSPTSSLSPPPLTHVSAMKPTIKAMQAVLPSPPVLQRAPKDPPARIPQPLLVPVIKRFPIPKVLKTVSKLVAVPKNDINDYNDFRPIQPKKKGIVGSVTTWLPPASSIRLASKPSMKPVNPANCEIAMNRFPQTIAIVNGKKYIVVPKHNVLNVSSQFPGNGGNLIPKQAENAPKITDVEGSQTAGSPLPHSSNPIKKEDLMDLDDKEKSVDTKLDDKVKNTVSTGDGLKDEYDNKVGIKIEDIGGVAVLPQ